MTSIFCTSVWSRKCCTSRRNAAASISVRVASGISVVIRCEYHRRRSKPSERSERSRLWYGGEVELPSSVTTLDHNGTTYFVVGTAHVSQRSVDEVRHVIA